MKRVLEIIFSLLLMLLTVSCASVKIDQNLQVLENCKFSESEDFKFLTISSKKRAVPRQVVLKDASKTAVMTGNISVIMPDAAVRRPDECWILPGSSARWILQPLLNGDPIRLRKNLILLDPGHGGSDPGAKGVSGKKEKDLNLLLAFEVAKELRRAGYEVKMTRSTDKTVPLGKRGILAEKYQADIFISLHHNSASNPCAAGIETFVLYPDDQSAQRYCAASVDLAYNFQLEQCDVTASPGRGVKFAGFRVLKDAKCPAILIEAGFMSNLHEEKLCATAHYRQRIAAAVVRAVKRSTVTQRSSGAGF